MEQRPEIVEVRMSMPNRHHFVVDLEPFGLDNPNAIFRVEDRPYGLIEAADPAVRRARPGPGLGAVPDALSTKRVDPRPRRGTLGNMLGFAMQYGIRPGPENLMGPVMLIIAGACVGAVLLPTTRLLVTRIRGWRTTRRTERRRLRAAATAELRARTMMSELCPFGWHAQITILEGPIQPAELDEDMPIPPAKVALDWTELSALEGRPAVMRRVWADSVGEAMEKMVADRRTDETLEQIEQGAVADGALWDDL